MAMSAGTVNWQGAGTGLSKELFDAESASISGDSSLSAALKQALLTGLAAKCTARAAVIVAHVQTAEVTVSVANTDVGLQTSTAVGAPTGPHVLPAPIALATKGTVL